MDLNSAQKLKQACQTLKENNADYYWVGFYILNGDKLHLGPYVGPATEHTQIPLGRGVCGYAVTTGQSQNIADVNSFSDYLACNVYTRSEYVGLVHWNNEIIGQLDIDCTTPGGFDPLRAQEIESLCQSLAQDLNEYRNECFKADL